MPRRIRPPSPDCGEAVNLNTTLFTNPEPTGRPRTVDNYAVTHCYRGLGVKCFSYNGQKVEVGIHNTATTALCLRQLTVTPILFRPIDPSRQLRRCHAEP